MNRRSLPMPTGRGRTGYGALRKSLTKLPHVQAELRDRAIRVQAAHGQRHKRESHEEEGSSRTILRPELADPVSSALPGSGFSDSGPGLRANGRWARATIRIGEKTWRRLVVAMNFDEVSRAFGTRVDGLVGQDLLREYERVTIDFRSGTILMSEKSVPR